MKLPTNAEQATIATPTNRPRRRHPLSKLARLARLARLTRLTALATLATLAGQPLPAAAGAAEGPAPAPAKPAAPAAAPAAASAAANANASAPVAAPAPTPAPPSPAVLAAGQKTFALCASCHQIGGTAGAAFGPQLTQVVGRRAGSTTDYNYSPAMKGANIVWTEQNLAAFLRDPNKVVPGTKMRFWGLSDERQIANLIAYMKSVK